MESKVVQIGYAKTAQTKDGDSYVDLDGIRHLELKAMKTKNGPRLVITGKFGGHDGIAFLHLKTPAHKSRNAFEAEMIECMLDVN